jgi:hypothetical protein
MNKTMKTKATAVVATLLTFGTALPVFAIDVGMGASAGANVRTGSTTVGTKVSAALTARIEKGKARAKEEIARRVSALGELGDKVNAMARVSAEMKTSIAGTVQSQIASLSSLQAKIEADTDIDTLKADIKSITESYRIFMLILPQGRITTAADSIHITTGTLSTLAGKLGVRITDAQTKGKDVATANTLLADMNVKIADAKVQADAAVSLTATLKPDNGDKTIMDANKKAIKDAQAKLKTAREDLKAARKAAGDIVKALKDMKTDATVAATTTTQ